MFAANKGWFGKRDFGHVRIPGMRVGLGKRKRVLLFGFLGLRSRLYYQKEGRGEIQALFSLNGFG